MNKKIIVILMALICFFSLNIVNAESVSNFIDLQSYETIYKLSEDSDVSLPFVKVFNDKAIFDKSINSSGLSIGAKTIEVNEKISGAQTIITTDSVEIKGTLEYGVILAGNVVISGNVEKDVLVMAESLFITDTASIGGDVVAIAETMEVEGNITGNLIASSANMLMNGNVGKDFRVYSDAIDFQNANVSGTIYIETNSELNISDRYPNATINKINTNIKTEEDKNIDIKETFIHVLTGVIVFTLLNLLMTKIKPNLFKTLTNKFTNNSSYAVLMGVLTLATIPVVSIILIFLSIWGLAVIAIPAMVVYIALIVVIISLAKFITGAVIYELIKNKLKVDNKLKEIGALLLVYAVVYLVCNMPYIAWIATMATILVSSSVVITGLTKKEN